MEKIWIDIVKERLRRNCGSALTTYSLKIHKKRNMRKQELPKNGLLLPLPNASVPGTAAEMPAPAQHQIMRVLPSVKLEDCYNVSSIQNLEYNRIPVSMFVIEQQPKLELTNHDVKLEVMDEGKQENEQTYKWPGIQEVMESYHKFSKGKLPYFLFKTIA